MRIAIIDTANQDLGLKILFPEADYYSIINQFDRSLYYNRYQFEPSGDLNKINDETYDTLFVISPLYNTLKTYKEKNNPAYNAEFDDALQQVIKIMNNNLKFANVCIFDNYDYDYDPNIIFYHHDIWNDNNVLFFKRNYSKTVKYSPNVYSFPYIIFGYRCNMDMLEYPREQANIKLNRLFFAGSIFTHNDDVYGIRRDRDSMINAINIVFPPGILHVSHYDYERYMEEMGKSKFALDLLGCGDPNIRSFEIFSTGTLRIAQRSNLKWNFDEDFAEETYFDNEVDLLSKLFRLMDDNELYERCLLQQQYIVKKYMNVNYLKKYVEDICETQKSTLVLVTSVINISGNPLSYTNTRSVFSPKERFDQTKNTIASIRKNLPSAKIFLLECTVLNNHIRDELVSLVDIFVNISDEDTPDRASLLNNINSTSKTLGESTLTTFALNYLVEKHINFDRFAKLSGRYWINHHFDSVMFNNCPNVVAPAIGETGKLCCSLYQLSFRNAIQWNKFIQDAMNNWHCMHQDGFETLFWNFIKTIDQHHSVTYVTTIGVSGFIAVDGSYNEW
jgi:hypothetical protein